MYRTSWLLATVVFFLSASATQVLAQNPATSLQDIRVDVIYLSSDYLEGRQTGTPGETLARQYIASRFEELGLTPLGTDGSWFQPFSFKYSSNPHASEESKEQRVGHNVVGFMDQGAETTVVVGAHYDHLGYGGAGSLQPGDSLIHNGADDNASGIAALLEIARQLKAAPNQNNNYLFIAFSGEEMGLFGSKYFVKTPTLPLEKINYMINLDMVGRLGEDKAVVVSGTGTSPVWDATLDGLTSTGFQFNKHASGVGFSDHTSFYLMDRPVLHFFTGQHSEYHKPADDSHLINFEGIHQIASLVVEVIASVDQPEALAFTKTKDEQQERRAARFKVSLGIMPDYTAEADGLIIDSVLDGKAGAKAGLEDGDIIIELGGVKVTDVYSYMEALSQFEAGDKTKVTVKRGEKKLEKDVSF